MNNDDAFGYFGQKTENSNFGLSFFGSTLDVVFQENFYGLCLWALWPLINRFLVKTKIKTTESSIILQRSKFVENQALCL